jgi:hypothetical protein
VTVSLEESFIQVTKQQLDYKHTVDSNSGQLSTQHTITESTGKESLLRQC